MINLFIETDIHAPTDCLVSSINHSGFLTFRATGNERARATITKSRVHTIGYLTATCLLAFLVYEYLGVSVIKRWWVNLDRIGAATLIVTGLLTPLW